MSRKPSEPSREFLGREVKKTAAPTRRVGLSTEFEAVPHCHLASGDNPFANSSKLNRTPPKRPDRSIDSPIKPSFTSRDSGIPLSILEGDSFKEYRDSSRLDESGSSTSDDSSFSSLSEKKINPTEVKTVDEFSSLDEHVVALYKDTTEPSNTVIKGEDNSQSEGNPSPYEGVIENNEETPQEDTADQEDDQENKRDNNRDDGDEEESNTNNRHDSESSEDEPRMARVKIQTPPTFYGKPHEDALDWVDRYETIGSYNGWADADLRKYFVIHLDGPARKWYLCNVENLPETWKGTDARGGNNGQPVVAAVEGTRDVFLKEFQKGNSRLYLEQKLRTRIQGDDECPIAYYYDIMNMCRLMDPNMPEKIKLDHLYQGLRKALFREMYVNQPETCEKFLERLKLQSEAGDMLKLQELRIGMVGSKDDPDDPESALIAYAGGKATYNQQRPTVESLMKELRELKVELSKRPIAEEKPNESNTSAKYDKSKSNRTSDGRPKCFNCGRPGHIKRFCRAPQKAEGTNGERPSPAQTNEKATAALVGLIQSGIVSNPESTSEVPSEKEETGNLEDDALTLSVGVFRIDYSRLITEEVLCCGHKVSAVVDTGAVISVLSPAKLLEMGLRMGPWDGPVVIMANNQRAAPLGAVYVDVDTSQGRISGKILVMQTADVELLLGNDLLSQLGVLIIEYPTDGPARLMGTLPGISVNAIMAEDTGKTLGKLTAKVDTFIPPWSVKAVPIKGTVPVQKEVLLVPAQNLFKVKGLTTGYAIVPGQTIETVMVANMTPEQAWLPMGAVLCEVEKVQDVIPVGETGVALGKQKPVIPRERFESVLGEGLTEFEKEAALDMLQRNESSFAKDDLELGVCPLVQHTINTGNAAPIAQAPYKSAWKERELIQTYVDRMKSQGIVEDSDSPWASPVVLAKKPDGTWRFCVDYRKINAITEDDVYPLPIIEDALNRLEGASLFSLMDLQAGYHQLEVAKDSRKKTAFITADGLFQFNVVPFGLKGAPSRFQRTMDVVLAGLKWTSCLVYIDDIVVWSSTFSEHLERLEKVLVCLTKAGLKLKLKKCRLFQAILKILGHIVSKVGVIPNPEKIKAVEEFPEPNKEEAKAAKVKLIQSFIGLCSYYRRHIQGFANIARPLTELTKKDAAFIWGEDQIQSFRELKKALGQAALLNFPKKDVPMEIYPDACGYGLGATLSQKIDGVEKPICFASRLVSKTEANYSITELECLALVWALKKFRSYIWGCKVYVYTDHQALTWLLTKRDLAGRLARWKLSIQEHDITIIYRSGKLHVNADSLSRYPVEQPIMEEEEDTCLQVGQLAFEESDNNDKTKLISEQEAYPKWGKIMLKLQKGKRHKNYFLKEGVLFIRTKGDGKMYDRLCVPKYLRERIYLAHHDDLMAGHMGMTKTRGRIVKKFWWPGLADDVNSYVRSCVSCQAKKGRPGKPQGFLQSIYVERPFQKVGIDIFGPLPVTEEGFRYVISAQDYLTKWVELRALITQTAEECAKFYVEDIMLRHGCPETIITDRGKCFISEMLKCVMKLMECNHKTTSGYHPQCNGQIERFNAVLAAGLSMYISSDQRNWHLILPYIKSAMNTSPQESTKMTPHSALYGVEARMLIDLDLGVSPDAVITEEEAAMSHVERIRRRLSVAHQIIIGSMRKVKEKQQKLYNEGRVETEYKVNDLVLIYKPIRKVGKSEKLLHRWLGPYTVLKVLSPVNYEVQLSSGRGKTDVVHVCRMKSFHQVLMDTSGSLPEPLDSSSKRGSDEESETNLDIDDGLPGVQEASKGGKVIKKSKKLPSVEVKIGKEVEKVNVTAPNVRRSTRIQERRLRGRIPISLVIPLILSIMCNLGFASPIIARGGVFFQQEAEVAFSESTWTLVCPLSLNETDIYVETLKVWATKQIEAAKPHKATAVQSLARRDTDANGDLRDLTFAHGMAVRMIHFCEMVLRKVEYIEKRMTVMKDLAVGSSNYENHPTQSPGRKKRNLIPFGGTALKWLFGVATSSDINKIAEAVQRERKKTTRISQLMNLQATLINDVAWASKENAKNIDELGKRLLRLQNWFTSEEKLLESHISMMVHVDDILLEVTETITWIEATVTNLENGISILTMGRLPLHLLKPIKVKDILNEVTDKLSPGWTFSTYRGRGDTLWNTYRDAEVNTGLVGQELQMYISIPVYEIATQFNVYKIINLPEAAQNGTHQVKYVGLPNYLAASADGDRYLELEDSSMRECLSSHAKICRFKTPIAKSDTRKSCSLALFKNDASTQAKVCKTEIGPWKGSQVVYLDHHRWGITDAEEQDLMVACPKKGSYTKRLPQIGIFEIPINCEARTREWIFPTNRQVEKFIPIAEKSETPPLSVYQDILPIDVKSSPGVVNIPPGENTFLARTQKIWEKANFTWWKTSVTKDELQGHLAEDNDKNIAYHHYPWEWVVVTIPILAVVTFLYFGERRLYARQQLLEHRMMQHENLAEGSFQPAINSMPNVHIRQEEIKMLPKGSSRIPRSRI